jgi:hypothetical protein
LYLNDNDFSSIKDECKVSTKDRFFRRDGFLFKENKLCMPNCSMRELLVRNCFIRELLVREAHGGGLMGHFGIAKTLDILHEHFYWIIENENW